MLLHLNILFFIAQNPHKFVFNQHARFIINKLEIIGAEIPEYPDYKAEKLKSMKKNVKYLFFTLCFLFFSICIKAAPVDIKTSQGNYIRVDLCSPEIIHFRVRNDDQFKESLTERYQIIKTDWSPVIHKSFKFGNKRQISTEKFSIEINEKDGSISIQGIQNKKINIQSILPFISGPVNRGFRSSLQKLFTRDFPEGGIIGAPTEPVQKSIAKSKADSSGCVIDIKLNPEECFYGLGSALRKHIQHRGYVARIWAEYMKAEAPSPFLMSTDGWAIYNNRTSLHYFDVGHFQENDLFVYEPGSKELDFYILVGNSMIDLLGSYTVLTGKPYVLPRWAYGLAFGSNNKEGEFNVLENALHFRSEKIPCDIYWLEPQWMKKRYDFSREKEWNLEKFEPVLYFVKNKRIFEKTKFIARMEDMGFRMALWLCINEDLSVNEEDFIAAKNNGKQSGQTNWFNHLSLFMDQGIKGFKIDPGATINDHPDRVYYNGKTDEEMHNIQQTLVVKQLQQMTMSYNHQRSFHHYCGGFTGIQHWGAGTTGDNGGSISALHDVLNQNLTGYPNVSCDVYPLESSSIHLGFLLPWVQINSWAYNYHPWYLKERLKNMVRDYAKLRYSLLPYIYSYALQATETGVGLLRAMPLIYPEVKELQDKSDEFMLGDFLLSAAFTNKVYLPEGNWIDYWTGKSFSGGQEIICSIPGDRGGPLFIKEGAILTYQPEMQYTDQFPLDTLIVKVYPSAKSAFTLFEDDGVSYEYLNNKIVKTEFECKADSKGIILKVNNRKGVYYQMPLKRNYRINIWSEMKPVDLKVNGENIKWEYDSKNKMIGLVTDEHVASNDGLRIQCSF